MSDDRVLIAGGGPVGVLTGLRLAQFGIPVTVFDQLDKPAEDHRAATLQPSTLDLFKPLGVIDRVLEQGLESRMFQWRDRATQEIVAANSDGVSPTGLMPRSNSRFSMAGSRAISATSFASSSTIGFE